MLREVIVCSECKGEDCEVIELRETEKIDMAEYARRHAFPREWSSYTNGVFTARRFQIICQDCGHTHEYMERIEKPQPMRFEPFYTTNEEV